MKNDPGFVHISPFLPVNFRFSIVGVWKDAFEPAKRAAPMTRGHAMSAKRTLDMRFSQTRNMTLQSARSSRPLVASVPVPAVRTPCARAPNLAANRLEFTAKLRPERPVARALHGSCGHTPGCRIHRRVVPGPGPSLSVVPGRWPVA